MLRRITVLSLTLMLMLGGPMTLPLAAQQNQNPLASALAIPVVGLVTGTITGTFNGTANITRFARSHGQLVAVGTLTGSVTDTTGAVVQSIAANFSAPVAAPVAIAQVACEILNLVLGPLHLDLLGLVIDIPNPVVLNITAVPGAGNLLGNLLCSVAGLLDGGGILPLGRLVNLLNDILAAL